MVVDRSSAGRTLNDDARVVGHGASGLLVTIDEEDA
jgi:hypothetical protein